MALLLKKITAKSAQDCLVSDLIYVLFRVKVLGTISQLHTMPLVFIHTGGLFFNACAQLGNMLTLLGGAEYTRVSWEQGLSDVSGFIMTTC